MPNATNGQPVLQYDFAEIDRIAQTQSCDTFYLLDFEALEGNYRELKAAFEDEYEPVQLSYSFKTNFTPAVCRTLKHLGCFAEVVSEMEYEMAVDVLGFEPAKVIVNGPMHRPAFVRRALLEGALFNFDAWHLLEIAAQVCRENPGRSFEIGIRIGYPIPEGHTSRFGIWASPENLRALAEWEKRLENCRIRGFHSHFSKSDRSLASYERRVGGLLEAAGKYFTSENPGFLDVGGGLTGKMPASLAAQQPLPPPGYRDYARTIAGAFRRRFPAGQGPTLFLEPGTALIADAQVFVAKIQALKSRPGKKLALVDASWTNLHPNWAKYYRPIRVLRQPNAQMEDFSFDVIGNTCVEDDVLARDVSGGISEGDYILFAYNGAYSLVFRFPFIHPCQPVFGKRGTQITVVKRAETTRDVLQTYVLD